MFEQRVELYVQNIVFQNSQSVFFYFLFLVYGGVTLSYQIYNVLLHTKGIGQTFL